MNKNNLKDLLLYLLVGGIATATEWGLFYLLGLAAVHYAVATTAAYILSTLVNWLVGRLLVFRENRPSVVKELAGIYLAGVVGLLLNLCIMWGLVDGLRLPEMLSKIAATGLVFLFHFVVRKRLIYRPKK